MATVVDLEVPAAQLGFEETFDRVPEFEFQLVGSIGESAPLAYVVGPDRGTVESALDADESVDPVARLADAADGRWLYRIDFRGGVNVFQWLVGEHGGTILEATGEDRRWSVQLLFHDRGSVSECHAVLERYGFRAEVARVSGADGDLLGRTPLTETQYETILTAYEMGYFDVPREVTLQELASELGVSHQALSERLRRSHAALVSAELSYRPASNGIDC